MDQPEVASMIVVPAYEGPAFLPVFISHKEDCLWPLSELQYDSRRS